MNNKKSSPQQHTVNTVILQRRKKTSISISINFLYKNFMRTYVVVNSLEDVKLRFAKHV